MNNTIDSLKKHWGKHEQLSIHVFENENYITLDTIKIDETHQNKGLGSMIIQELCEYADNKGKIIKLTLSNSFGSSKRKLEYFYGKFEFIKNKGKKKNFDFQESHFRLPKE